MGESDIERLRAGFAQMAEEGYESMVPMIDPEFRMDTPAGLAAEPQRYEGIDGFRRWWSTFYEAMDDIRIEPETFVEAGEGRVAIQARLVATGKSSGLETSQQVFLLATVRDGQILRIDFHETLEDALAAGPGD